MKNTMETVARAIIITVLGIAMAGVIFFGTKVVNYTNRGWDLMAAVKDTACDVQEMFKVEAEENVDIQEFPMVNANISWNCLNKKEP